MGGLGMEDSGIDLGVMGKGTDSVRRGLRS